MTGSLVAARNAARNAVRDARHRVGGGPGALAGDTPRDTGPAAPASTESGSAPLLTVSGLNLSYGRLRALSDINLTVQSGELVALAGENGAGKTTLVRCIAGDVVPASGEIYLGGTRVPPDPGGAARQGLAVVWQDLALRQGRILADLRPADTHPDDVVALLSGQTIDSTARRQLTRLHGLTDRLVSADPGSSLSLILSALGAALSTERLCIHLVSDRSLFCAASLGFTPGELEPWSRLPFGPGGGPVGLAAADGRPVIADHVRAGPAWRSFRDLAKTVSVASSWSVPVLGPGGLSGVITVFRTQHGAPQRDELDLVTVYAGYAASAIERDRLLDQVTTRNRVLETIREVLETLAGPVLVSEGLVIALQSLRRGLQAEEVALITQPAGQPASWRAYAGPK